MGSTSITPPEGFVLDSPALESIPQPPDGFIVDDENHPTPPSGFVLDQPQSVADAAANTAMKGIATGAGEAAKGLAAFMFSMPPGDEFGRANKATWDEYYRRQAIPNAQKMQEIQREALYEAGQKVVEGAEQRWPVSAENKNALPVKVADAAAGFVVPLATGPLAPMTMGFQSAGSHISGDYEALKKHGKSDEEAATVAFNRAVTSGGLQASVFATLPKPLRSAGEKMIVEKIGGEGFKRWMAGRAATGAEGAVIGGVSGGGEAAIAGQPVLPAAAHGAAGMATLNQFMPYLRKRQPANEPRQTETEEVPLNERRDPDGKPLSYEDPEIPLGPGAQNASEHFEGTSLKNATADVERLQMGMPPADPTATRKMAVTWIRAGEIASQDPMAAERVTADLIKDPTRGMTDLDSALVLRHKVELENRINDAVERQHTATTAEEKAAARETAETLSNQLQDLMDAAKARGSEWGREGRWRQAVAYEDFSFAAQEQKLRARKGGEPLTDTERVELEQRVAEHKAKADELAAREAARKADESDAATKQAMKDAVADVSKGRVDPLAVTDEPVAPSKPIERKQPEPLIPDTQIKEPLVSPPAEPPRSSVAAKTAGAEPATKSAQVSSKLVDEPQPKPAPAAEKPAVNERIDAIKDKIEAAQSKGDTTGIHRLAKQLARAIIERDRLGEKDIETLLAKLHAELQKVIPDITPSGARDAFSGIGIYKMPSADRVSAAMADLRQQALLLGQAERIETRKPVPPTGPQRRPISDTARRILQKVNDLKRRFGVNVASPELQLRSALQARERWYQNRIADLLAEIKTGERMERSGPPRLTNTKLEALRAEYERVKAEHAAIFKRPDMTDAQRLKLALAGAERAEAAWNQRLANAKKGVFDPATKQTKKLTSPEIEAIRLRTEAIREEVKLLKDMAFPKPTPEQQRIKLALAGAEKSLDAWNKKVAAAEKGDFGSVPIKPELKSVALDGLRAKRDAAKAEYERLQKAAFPPPSPEAVALQMLKTRIAQRMADYQDRMARGDFAPKARREPSSDNETIRLRAELEGIKQKFAHAREKAAWEQMSVFQKGKRALTDTYDAARLIMTTGELSFILRQGKWSVLSHPKQSSQALASMFRAFGSEQRAREEYQRILDHPDFNAAKRAKLHFVDENSTLTRQEEIFMGRWAHALPIVSNFNRAAEAFLNKIRFDTWIAMRRSSVKNGRATAEFDKAIAQFVNESTGRGTLGKFESSALFLGRAMFSPRYFWSRVQLAFGHSMWGGTRHSRWAIAQEYVRSLIGLGLYYSMLYLGASLYQTKRVSIETDARSSDFGKVRIGSSRIDPLAGLAQVITLAGRTILGQTKTISGEVRPIRAPLSGQPLRYGQDDWYDVAARFARTKLHPVPGNIASLFSGTEMDGSKASTGRLALKMVTPITYLDVYEALNRNDLPTGASLSLLTLLGEGLQNYSKSR